MTASLPKSRSMVSVGHDLMRQCAPRGRGTVRESVRQPEGPTVSRPQQRVGKHTSAGHELGVGGGLSALSLDALSSVAYGPEAMMLVLVAAGASALRFTLPITLVITGML